MDSNPLGAIIGAIIGAVIGALVWAGVTIVLRQEFGMAAIAVGFLTGLFVRSLGKGMTSIYGIIGALFTIIGCTLGKLFKIIFVKAKENGISITEALKSFDLSATIPLVQYTFNTYDFFFYAVALFTG